MDLGRLVNFPQEPFHRFIVCLFFFSFFQSLNLGNIKEFPTNCLHSAVDKYFNFILHEPDIDPRIHPLFLIDRHAYCCQPHDVLLVISIYPNTCKRIYILGSLSKMDQPITGYYCWGSIQRPFEKCFIWICFPISPFSRQILS